MITDPLLYGGFAALVVVLLAIDLLVVHRDVHTVTVREAAVWSGIWIGVAVAFGLLVVPLHAGPGTPLEYFTGYLVEKSLSVDNVFLFLLIFSALGVPRELQHRVLFYGVLGAILMRTALIFAGAALIERFDWILFVFGAFLMYAGWRTWRARDAHADVEGSGLLRTLRKVLPTTGDYRGQRFVVREGGRWLVTPLFVVLILVEGTDLVFAFDSIPAIFAVTRDPFVVLTSNVFAILGLRALYFLMAGFADRLRYLKAGLAVVLGYVGLKIFTENIEQIPHPGPLVSLGVIVAVLTVAVVASVRADRVGGISPTGVGPFPTTQDADRDRRES